MQITHLEILAIFIRNTLPLLAGMFCFTWLFFTCFKIDSDNKLKGNYFIWKNLSFIKDDPELKSRIIEHMRKIEEKNIFQNKKICVWSYKNENHKTIINTNCKAHIERFFEVDETFDKYCSYCGGKIELKESSNE